MRATEQAQFTATVAARLAWLRRLAFAVCGDWHRADDLVQDVLIKLYVAWPLRDEGAIDAWLRTTLIRQWTDQTRTAWWRRERLTDIVPEGVPSNHAVEEGTGGVEFLSGLPSRQRVCLALRFLGDCSVAETARVMDISTGTVKSLTSRALAQLRQHPELPGERGRVRRTGNHE